MLVTHLRPTADADAQASAATVTLGKSSVRCGLVALGPSLAATDRLRAATHPQGGTISSHRAGTEKDRPATYRQVFAGAEFRAVFAATVLSLAGDCVAKVAVAALLYERTGSVLASAGGLAVSCLPWLCGGPLLIALAERYPYRRVLVCCDVGRLVMVGLAGVPHLPLPAVPAMLFVAAMLSPPFDASRSALLPHLLPGDRYVVGLAVTAIARQCTEVSGLAAGGVLAAIDPTVALFADAATFGVSAVLIWRFVEARPAAATGRIGRGILRETGDGFRIVFGTPVLRAIAVVVLSASAFAILPTGLAAGWAAELHGGSLAEGLIMASGPVGMLVGGVVVGRLTPPAIRHRLIRPLALLVPAALAPALLAPPLAVVLVLGALAGFGISLTPPANGLFVQALPTAYRARAFGVMGGAMQLIEGAVILASGAVASVVGVSSTVGLWALAGIVVVVLALRAWPRHLNTPVDRAGSS